VKHTIFIFVAVVFLAGCVAETKQVKHTATTPIAVDPLLVEEQIIDELPMYVGIDKADTYKLTDKDKLFIRSALKGYYLTLEKAALQRVAEGFRNIVAGKKRTAMKLFNKAWLLNPENPEIYWGMAMVLETQSQFCNARILIDKAYTKRLRKSTFLIDAAFIDTACAIEDKTLISADKEEKLLRADKLFKRTYHSKNVDEEYALHQWARALLLRGKTKTAREKICALEKVTGQKYTGGLLEQLRGTHGTLNGTVPKNDPAPAIGVK